MRIAFYLTRSGRSPVEEFIREQPVPLQAAIARAIDRLEEHGIRTAEDEMILLHAYRKQTQKAPAREIGIAMRRMHEVMD